MRVIFIHQKQLLLVSNEDPIITSYITPPAFLWCLVSSASVPLVSSTLVNISRIGPSSDVRANKCNDKLLSSESPSKCCILGGQIFRPHSAIVLATFRILPQHFLAPAHSSRLVSPPSSAPPPTSVAVVETAQRLQNHCAPSLLCSLLRF